MMSKANERLVQWLRDAHAMEEQAETMLSRTAQRLENYPLLKAKLEEHLGETQRQAERISECIERLDGSSSAIKDAVGKFTGFAQAVSGLFAGDEVMKAALASYTFEHMEIASYRILVETAEEAGEPDIKRICEEILREEEAMGAWLEDNFPAITKQFLSRDKEAGTTAKH
jgi:ferritin-like metal-binding protein YciE